ncbi:MAG: phosphomannomutase/phosphoglucomutase [Candidatus Woesebacteria bacterium]|jgi:phosphomannomutase
MIRDIFKAYDVRGKVGTELTPEVANNIAKAFADWLPTDGIIAVGRDMRPDSADLADAVIKGLTDQGRDVWDIGLVTSDMIYYAVGRFGLSGGVVVTASHNPGEYNGIKLYRDQVIPVGLDSGLSKIRDAVLSKTFKPAATEAGNVEKRSITDGWIKHCLSFITKLKPYHIAIDAGNGMAGAILPSLLPRLPLKVEKMYFDIDGTFPNHEANPTKPENLTDLIAKVKENKLDFGIAFDGDGDRAGFVDDRGRVVSGSDLVSIAARYYLDKKPGAKVVCDVRMSHSVTELVQKWGGSTVTCKAGRVNIGPKMREVGAVFGGETSGHFFFHENYDADSGLIGALVVMQAISNSGKKLSQLVDEYHLHAMGPEQNFTVSDQNAVFARLKSEFTDGKQSQLDGLTVEYSDKWFNIRASNTEPLIRLNAEAATQTELDKFVDRITKVIQNQE